jgi:hypothetical protein
MRRSNIKGAPLPLNRTSSAGFVDPISIAFIGLGLALLHSITLM